MAALAGGIRARAGRLRPGRLAVLLGLLLLLAVAFLAVYAYVAWPR